MVPGNEVTVAVLSSNGATGRNEVSPTLTRLPLGASTINVCEFGKLYQVTLTLALTRAGLDFEQRFAAPIDEPSCPGHIHLLLKPELLAVAIMLPTRDIKEVLCFHEGERVRIHPFPVLALVKTECSRAIVVRALPVAPIEDGAVRVFRSAADNIANDLLPIGVDGECTGVQWQSLAFRAPTVNHRDLAKSWVARDLVSQDAGVDACSADSKSDQNCSSPDSLHDRHPCWTHSHALPLSLSDRPLLI